MRFLAWNIQHGGGPARVPQIALALLDAQADVVALCEYRARRGGQLRALLCDHGLSSQVTSDALATENGVLIASRRPLAKGPDLAAPAHLRRRWATAIMDVGSMRVAIAMVHVPDDTQPSDKAAFWQGLCAFADAQRADAAIILGDFNTARREDIRSGFRTRCDAKIGQLAAYGYGDAYSIANAPPAEASVDVEDGCVASPRHAGARAISWKGPLNQASRIDAAYVSRSLRPLVRACAYRGLEADCPEFTGKPIGFPQSPEVGSDPHPSDHAMLLVDVAVENVVETGTFPHESG